MPDAPALEKPSMQVVEIDTAVTPSLHPQNLLSIEGYDATTSGYVTKALEAFETAYAGLSAVHKARAATASNPVLNDSARLLQVADYAARHQDAILKKFDGARDMLVKAIEANRSMLTAPLKASAERPVIASEVRAFVKGLSTAEREAWFNERQKAGDIESLQIVLGSPPYLSGLSEEEVSVRTRHYHTLKSPEVARRLSVMTEALRLVETRGPLVLREMEKALGSKGGWGKVNKLRAATTAAQQAFIMSDGAGSAIVR